MVIGLKISTLALIVVSACTAPLGSLALGCHSAKAEPSTVSIQSLNLGTPRIQFTRCQSDGASGRFPVKVKGALGAFPNVSWTFATPADFSSGSALLWEVKNTSDRKLTFGIRMDDDPKSSGGYRNRTGTFELEAGQSKVVAFPLAEGGGFQQFRLTGRLETIPTKTNVDFDPSHIYKMQVFVVQADEPASFIVSGISLQRGKSSIEGLIDQYGQNAEADYPGKITQNSDFAAQLRNETFQPVPSDWNRWGGWKSGAKLEATGKFRIAKVGQQWSFVDPDGAPYYLMGVDAVRISTPTKVEGREKLFRGNPRLESANNTTVTDFYRQNLEKKFGANVVERFIEHNFKRLDSWGFNTLGEAYLPELANSGRPFVVTNISQRYQYGLNAGSNSTNVPDPYAADFPDMVRTRIRNAMGHLTRNRAVVGFTFDNEMAWAGFRDRGKGRYALASKTLERDAASCPAKQAFLAALAQKYRLVSQLNRAWGTTFDSWNDLSGPVKLPSDRDLGGDFSQFVYTTAAKYFRTVRDTLRMISPDTPYLGCRFASYSPEVLRAAEEYCDALSFNIYAARLDTEEYTFLNDLKRPVLITEFHFGATDRGGMSGGLFEVKSQAERGQRYQEYAMSCLKNPNIIGFQYYEHHDQPLTGRPLDGENFAIGLVTITDTPYEEMLAKVQEVNRRAYQIRFGS